MKKNINGKKPVKPKKPKPLADEQIDEPVPGPGPKPPTPPPPPPGS